MNIAIMGFGTVGSGAAELLRENHDHILKNSMQDSLELTHILDLRDFPGSPYEPILTHDFNDILNDAQTGIVVETMGGIHPAYEFVSACLEAGKSVVTSNKELVAEKGCQLLRLAESKNVNFLFEASVGGGIPIIRPISQCLAANEFGKIAGILNGTTNYILTRMFENSVSFEAALKEAQDRGYAERDPSSDIDGIDTARKISILASLAFGKHVYPKDVKPIGISGVTEADVKRAAEQGCVVKLLATAEKLRDGRIDVEVRPAFIRKTSPLAPVSGVYNAILVKGNATEDVMFYGRGAGKMPTASAVIADVIDCCKHVGTRKFFGWEDSEPGYTVSGNASALEIADV